MSQTPQTQNIETAEFHNLGKKTFAIFLLDRTNAGFIFLLLSIVLFVISGQPFTAVTPVGNLQGYVELGGWIALAVALIAFGIALLVSWLIYRNYVFALDEDSLKIKRGVLNKEEISIPYRQIQDVDINRDLAYQMLGMSRIVILTAGHDDDSKDAPDESAGILPAIDKTQAEWLQNELLKRTDVQRVTEVNPT